MKIKDILNEIENKPLTKQEKVIIVNKQKNDLVKTDIERQELKNKQEELDKLELAKKQEVDRLKKLKDESISPTATPIQTGVGTVSSVIKKQGVSSPITAKHNVRESVGYKTILLNKRKLDKNK